MIAPLERVRMEVHDLVAQLPYLIQCFAKCFPACNKIQLAPVRIVLEKALVLAERKISCAFDILFSLGVGIVDGRPMLSGSNVASMIRRRFDSIRPSTRNGFASA